MGDFKRPTWTHKVLNSKLVKLGRFLNTFRRDGPMSVAPPSWWWWNGGDGAVETVHHEVRTAVHRQLLEEKGKPSVLPYFLMYIPCTLTTLTLPEL